MSLNPFPFEYLRSDAPVIPAAIYLGASSWTHEFWKGQIYHASYKSEKDFNLNSLKEYAAVGLFTLVEIDSSYYKPPSEETLQKYAELVPDNFIFTAKLWERLCIPVYPSMKRYGKLAGQENPSFLNPKVLQEEVLPAFRTPSFYKKFGAFLLQFSPMSSQLVRSRLFFHQLETFLEAFPKDFKLSIEIRNSELLSSPYIQLLNRYSVSHCFNHWYSMPSMIDQMKAVAVAGGLSAEHYMARLITPLRVRYEEAKKLFEPFYQIKKRDEQARADVVRLARRALQRNIPAYVVVNNRFEGNTPDTVKELEELLSAQLREGYSEEVRTA